MDKAQPSNLYEVALGVANTWATKQYGDDYLGDERNRNGMVDLANAIYRALQTTATPLRAEEDLRLRAINLLACNEWVSCSLFQRRLSIGYVRAKDCLEQFVQEGRLEPMAAGGTYVVKNAHAPSGPVEETLVDEVRECNERPRKSIFVQLPHAVDGPLRIVVTRAALGGGKT